MTPWDISHDTERSSLKAHNAQLRHKGGKWIGLIRGAAEMRARRGGFAQHWAAHQADIGQEFEF